MQIGNRQFDTEQGLYIMGILNVTPDSFSDGGRFNEMDAALAHVEQMIEDGCDILDIGGESTRPNHIKISSEEEIARVCPYIEKIKERFDIPVSLDTYKAEVARAGILAGADMINDIWGLKWNQELADAEEMSFVEPMAPMLARYQVPVCVMHNRKPANTGTVSGTGTHIVTSLGNQADTDANPFGYHNVVEDVIRDLEDCIHIADRAGVDRSRIILDPGIGFGKTLADNLVVMQHLEDIRHMGYPVLLGTSRKSMIGLTLHVPVEEREEGTMATSVIGAMKGCSFFRVHDVLKNRRALEMTRAVLNAG